MVINICNILAAKIPSNLKIVNVWQQMNFLLITLGQIKIQQIQCIHYVIKSKEIKIEVFCKYAFCRTLHITLLGNATGTILILTLIR